MPDPHDPYHPDWRPDYNPNHGLGDVGSGRGFGADLYELYYAGRISLPIVAEIYSGLSTGVEGLADRTRAVLELDGYAEPAQRLLLKLRGDLERVLAQTSSNVEDAGAALVRMAALFAATDEAAAEAFARELDDDQALLEDAPPPPEPEETL